MLNWARTGSITQSLFASDLGYGLWVHHRAQNMSPEILGNNFKNNAHNLFAFRKAAPTVTSLKNKQIFEDIHREQIT